MDHRFQMWYWYFFCLKNDKIVQAWENWTIRYSPYHKPHEQLFKSYHGPYDGPYDIHVCMLCMTYMVHTLSRNSFSQKSMINPFLHKSILKWILKVFDLLFFFEKFEVRNWEMKLSSCEIPAADQSADKISISFGEYPLY